MRSELGSDSIPGPRKILLASDLHSLPKAFAQFTETLKRYDAGIIAGDIVDEYVPDHELIEKLHLSPDDFMDELPAPDETADDMVKRWKESEQAEYLHRGLLIKEQEVVFQDEVVGRELPPGLKTSPTPLISET